MGQNGCVRCEKSGRDFVARTFALIAPGHTVLQQVSRSYETITDEPKHYETYQNLSFGSNGADWVRSLWNIPTRHRGTNYFFNCTNSPCFALTCSDETIPNASKHYETHQNMRLRSNGVDQVRSLWKIITWLRGTNFCINYTSSVCFATSFMQLRNDPKCTQILRSAPKH